ncbi:hypothetical protein DPX16_11933 [Anabarilius grahami]|uniref:Uncharacterized protein n=1 Tax=Anabarilius grahami TaxID=495550 RepID=A0A3N0YDF9_ANAGA|nr:hypothetical protein DPX16_11933 [Anabarilius grahami]
MRPRRALQLSPQVCELRRGLYLAVKAALCYEGADSEEDREGLGCHLGFSQNGAQAPSAPFEKSTGVGFSGSQLQS